MEERTSGEGDTVGETKMELKGKRVKAGRKEGW